MVSWRNFLKLSHANEEKWKTNTSKNDLMTTFYDIPDINDAGTSAFYNFLLKLFQVEVWLGQVINELKKCSQTFWEDNGCCSKKNQVKTWAT